MNPVTLSYYCVRCRCANLQRPLVPVEMMAGWMDSVFCAWCKFREDAWSTSASDRSFLDTADLVARGEM